MSLLPVAVKHKVRLTIKSPREIKLSYTAITMSSHHIQKKMFCYKKKMTQSADRYDTFLYSKCPISATLMS